MLVDGGAKLEMKLDELQCSLAKMAVAMHYARFSFLLRIPYM